MVSESKILGQSSLIFLTLGSTHFPFDRLLSSVDLALSKLSKPYRLIVQDPVSEYKWNYKNILKMRNLSPGQIIKYFKKAEKIITHGGFGTIFEIAKYSKNMPFIVARSSHFQEHVDDHQVFFIKFLRTKLPKSVHNHLLYNSSSMNEEIELYLRSPVKKNLLKETLIPRHQNKPLITNLKEYLYS